MSVASEIVVVTYRFPKELKMKIEEEAAKNKCYEVEVVKEALRKHFGLVKFEG